MIDWDDLRFVLAVARSGSALRAAHELGVNQTTVTRRMTHIEAAIGADLFQRKPSGYALTPLGQRVAATAARIEDDVKALESAISAEQRALSGSVRITTLEEARRYPNAALTMEADSGGQSLATCLVECIGASNESRWRP